MVDDWAFEAMIVRLLSDPAAVFDADPPSNHGAHEPPLSVPWRDQRRSTESIALMP